MDGTALFEGMAAVFLAYLFNVPLTESAIIAVFSPQRDWFQNVSQANRALKAIEELLDAVKGMSSDVKEESK